MMYGMRVAAGVVLVASVLVVPTPATAQRGGDPDSLRSTRSLTAEEYQALRRQWLEMRRSGLIEAGPPRYGSAVVGAPAAGPPGPAGQFAIGPEGGLPVRCSGVLTPGSGGRGGTAAGRPGRPGDYVFRGTCGPTYGRGYGPGGPDGAQGPGFGYPWPAGSGWTYGMAPGFGNGPGYGGPGFNWPGFGGTGSGGPGYGGPGFGFDGITEYVWTGWGWYPSVGTGFGAGPGAAYSFAPWAGAAGTECARIRLETVNGTGYEIVVALRAMGVADARDLDLAIDYQLSRGQAIDLMGVDGRRLRIEPGTLLGDIRTSPCTRD